MRRREKFVIASILLSVGLLAVQYVPVEYRYWAVAILALLSYLVSAWALSNDLQRYELVTIVPFPTLYSASVGLFYFLLPSNLLSRILILGLFGVGMYAIYLTSNILSVAKGRSIQLLHAAHAIGLFFTLIASTLFLNTIFSLRLHFWWNAVLVGISHFPLIFLSLWSINLERKIPKEIVNLSGMLTLLLVELAAVLSFYPFSIWHHTLFVMSVLYIGLGILHNYIKGRLFSNTLTEFSLVGFLVMTMFVIFFPGK